MPNYQEAYVSLVRAVENALRSWDDWEEAESTSERISTNKGFLSAMNALRRELQEMMAESKDLS